MGAYDTVRVPCPDCKKIEFFQSKSGDRRFQVYELDNCPRDVLENVNRHSPYTCSNCETSFMVKLKLTGTSVTTNQ